MLMIFTEVWGTGLECGVKIKNLIKNLMATIEPSGRAEWTFGHTNLVLRGEVNDGDLILRNCECINGM